MASLLLELREQRCLAVFQRRDLSLQPFELAIDARKLRIRLPLPQEVVSVERVRWIAPYLKGPDVAAIVEREYALGAMDP